mmetsp:Transcript_4382/g.11992  ORF Transcript_4382/g.11992 Transcript_4382/m.11992 type:complete len:98 (-) Transcript_4382:69-362(-)
MASASEDKHEGSGSGGGGGSCGGSGKGSAKSGSSMMTKHAASHIQSVKAKQLGGYVSKGGFASRAQSAAAKHQSQQNSTETKSNHCKICSVNEDCCE